MSDKSSPQRVFLYIAFLFGILYIVFTPPFQPQDEANHFNRAWQVSTGTFSPIKQNQRLGGYIPTSLEKLNAAFNPYILNKLNKISPEQLWKARLIPLNQKDTIFIDFTNTALYSAFLYIPQAAGISIGKMFDMSPFWLIYFGRISNLLVFIILLYSAIKIVPFKKWLFVLLAVLPISFTTNSSMSADMLVNSISFLTIAIILNLSFNENIKQLSYKQIIIILLLSVLMGLAKLVYVPVLFLLVLIPSEKFNSAKAKILIIAISITVGFGTAVIQKSIIDSKYIPYSEYNAIYRDYTALNKGCDINKQIDFIKENPKQTVKVFIKSFFREFNGMTRGYISLIGWNHNYPAVWLVILVYFIVLFLTLFNLDINDVTDLTFTQRIYFGIVGFILTFLIMLSQYLSWDLVGESRAYPLIGRYFIPVFPLFFIMLANLVNIKPNFSVLTEYIHKIVPTFCIFLGTLGLFLIVTDSYTLNNYSNTKWNFSWSFKENYNDTTDFSYLISDKDTIAVFTNPKGSFISEEKVFTGSNSIKISESNPYGFTLKILNARANDKIVVSFRSYGYGGFLNFQEFPEGTNYWIHKPYMLKDSLGWKYQEAEFILPNTIQKGTELRVFAWWPYSNSIYLDKFSVTYFAKD